MSANPVLLTRYQAAAYLSIAPQIIEGGLFGNECLLHCPPPVNKR